jgi:hypothetical protein
MTAAFTLILPILLLVPKKLIATSDGEQNPEADVELMAEFGGAAVT